MLHNYLRWRDLQDLKMVTKTISSEVQTYQYKIFPLQDPTSGTNQKVKISAHINSFLLKSVAKNYTDSIPTLKPLSLKSAPSSIHHKVKFTEAFAPQVPPQKMDFPCFPTQYGRGRILILLFAGRSTGSNIKGSVHLKLWLSSRENRGLNEEEDMWNEIWQHQHIYSLFLSHQLQTLEVNLSV